MLVDAGNGEGATQQISVLLFIVLLKKVQHTPSRLKKKQYSPHPTPPLHAIKTFQYNERYIH